MQLETQLMKAVRVVENFPKPGISFKDISPILLDPELVADCITALAEPWQGMGIQRVLGIESRGFLFGPGIAKALNAGFVIVRKAGKLPPETHAISYALEYGEATIEISKNALEMGHKTLIHDDLLATGGTAAAAAQLVIRLGASVQGFSFLSELEFLNGRNVLMPYSDKIQTILKF